MSRATFQRDSNQPKAGLQDAVQNINMKCGHHIGDIHNLNNLGKIRDLSIRLPCVSRVRWLNSRNQSLDVLFHDRRFHLEQTVRSESTKNPHTKNRIVFLLPRIRLDATNLLGCAQIPWVADDGNFRVFDPLTRDKRSIIWNAFPPHGLHKTKSCSVYRTLKHHLTLKIHLRQSGTNTATHISYIIKRWQSPPGAKFIFLSHTSWEPLGHLGSRTIFFLLLKWSLP